jgi:TRAP-type C4-dicarboxylate transport system substrate-binding protein
LTSYGGEKSKLLAIPFTFVNRDHFWSFATSDLAPEFLLEPHENGSGVRGLFYGEEGFRHFFSSKKLDSIEDLKGMKIRVSVDPVMTGMVKALGASPTVVSFGELYSALQTGVVDAAEQPIANYKANSFQEVAPTMILNGHTLGAIQVIITDDAWDKLSKEQQNMLTEAGKYASEYNRQISEDAENQVIEDLKAEGVKLVEVDDVKPWQEACKDIIEAESAQYSDLYQQILDMQ